ncbi:MAG: DOPA 4,5-dioxygenase family protein [Pseudomonadota bacterium]
MTDTVFSGWHAHVYYSPEEHARAKALCDAAVARFGVSMGRMHDAPIGPHPRGSCQIEVPPAQFAEVMPWLVANRDGLTVFVHGESGDAVADHTKHVVWLGPSEPLNLAIFGL